MDGFYLLLGHLVGDYLTQNDWQAKNKVNPLTEDPEHLLLPRAEGQSPPFADRMAAYYAEHAARMRAEWVGHLACTVHCVLYTLAVWAFSFHWMPGWGLAVVFLAHWPLDRFRLARLWMTRVAGQTAFATGPLAPWSVIVVDNIFHLLVLAGIAAAAWPATVR